MTAWKLTAFRFPRLWEEPAKIIENSVCLPIFLPIRILIDRNFFEQSRLVLTIRYDTFELGDAS